MSRRRPVREKKEAATKGPPVHSLHNPGRLPDEDAERLRQRERERDSTALEDEAATEETDILAALRSEIGAGAYIRLYRQKATDSKMALIETQIPIANFTLDYVLKTYGGGDYKASACRSDGTFVKAQTFTIDHTIPSTHPREARQPMAPQSGAVDLPAVIDALKKSAPSDSGGGITAMISLMVTMMQENTKMVVAMLDKRSGGGTEDLTRLLVENALKNKTTPQTEILESFRTLKAIERGDSPDEGEPSTPTERIIEKILPHLPKFIEGILTATGVAPQPARQPINVTPAGNGATPAPNAAPGATAAPETSTDDPAMLKMFIGQFRSAAIQAAEDGQDPFAFVQAMTSLVPRKFHAAVFQVANAETWYADIFAADPGAAKHLKFLTEVRNAILYLALFNLALADCKAGVLPTESAKKFVGWASETFRDDLADAADDPVWFGEIFGPHYLGHQAWIDELRQDFVRHLNEPIVPVPPKPEKPVPAGKK